MDGWMDGWMAAGELTLEESFLTEFEKELVSQRSQTAYRQRATALVVSQSIVYIVIGHCSHLMVCVVILSREWPVFPMVCGCYPLENQ